jgi:dihydrofolate reductase
MRKVVAALFSSLDGVVEAPNEWQFAFDDEMGAAMSRLVDSQDTILLGRVTWSEWAGYWPTSQDEPFAGWINRTPKHVLSSTLKSVDEWPNSTLVTGPVAEHIRSLREQDGGTIGTAGSPTLVRSLVEQGLVDELVLYVHPVIAGGGRRRLFPPDSPLIKLELVSAEPTSSGTVITTSRPAA